MYQGFFKLWQKISYVESKETVQNNKVQSYLSNNQFVVILLLVGTVIVAFFIVRFKKRHNN